MGMTKEQIWELAHAVYPFAVEVRRHLHRNPELSYEERETSSFVADRIREMGFTPQTGVGGYGVKVVIEGGRPGPTIGLRADMDALPIHEETGLEFSSARPGVMHACGHDIHTATLLATAKALSGRTADLAGKVVLIFQPGEEKSPGGASLMIRDGVLQNPTLDFIYGLHVMPLMEAGTMGFGAGPRMAAPDHFEVTIRGRGGHGASPHLTVDPVLAAAQCITLLQQIVARNVSPFQNGVITIGVIQGGSAANVIPDEVRFEGTVRTMEPGVQEMMERRIEQVVRGVSEAAGATYQFKYVKGYPMLVNDEAATERARQAALAVLDAGKVGEMVPSMGGEDFAFFLQQVPGSFGRLGSNPPGAKSTYLHTSTLMIDETCMQVGVAYYLSLIQNQD